MRTKRQLSLPAGRHPGLMSVCPKACDNFGQQRFTTVPTADS